MAEIIKVYRQSIPALRFIGKKYSNSDRVSGMFASKWNEWWQNGWFDFLEKHIGVHSSEIYEDGDAYLGLMRWKELFQVPDLGSRILPLLPAKAAKSPDDPSLQCFENVSSFDQAVVVPPSSEIHVQLFDNLF